MKKEREYSSTTLKGIDNSLHMAVKILAVKRRMSVNDIYLEMIFEGARTLGYYLKEKKNAGEEGDR